MDDMIVNSSEVADHTTHFEVLFKEFGRHNMGLNPNKCILGVKTDELLGYYLTKRWDKG